MKYVVKVDHTIRLISGNMTLYKIVGEDGVVLLDNMNKKETKV